MQAEGFLFKQGFLSVRKGLLAHKRHVTLTAPITMDNVQTVFETLFVTDPYAPIQAKAIPCLGQIAFAAARNIPLMIIASNEHYDDPHFLPLDISLSLREEEEMAKPCCFEIYINQQTIVFSAPTSTEYQQWIGCLHSAMERSAHSNYISPQVSHSTSAWLASLPKGAETRNRYSHSNEGSLEIQDGIVPLPFSAGADPLRPKKSPITIETLHRLNPKHPHSKKNCESLLQKAEEDKRELSPAALHSVVSFYCNLDSLLSSKWADDYRTLEAIYSQTTLPDAKTKAQDHSRLFVYFARAQQSGVTFKDSELEKILGCASREGNATAAEEAFRLMRRQTPASVASMIRSYSKDRQFEKAADCFERHIQERDIGVYVAYSCSLVSKNDTTAAIDLLARVAKDQGVRPTIASYNELLLELILTNNCSEALELPFQAQIH
ncbi:hypothetical protein HDV03_004724 [Kappamyces sp. JEL0829]|nr:hypothetical protein HDV03_004724 [Kappamyces sp. JEL0829]